MSQDAEIHNANDVIITIIVYADAAKTTRKDLSGASVDYIIGNTRTDTRFLKKAASITDAGNGVAIVTLTKSELASLSARRWSHQVFVTDGTGRSKTVTDGNLTVSETLPTA